MNFTFTRICIIAFLFCIIPAITIAQTNTIVFYGDTTKFDLRTDPASFQGTSNVGYPTSDGGDIFIAIRDSFRPPASSVPIIAPCLVKTNSNGNIVWSKIIPRTPNYTGLNRDCYQYGGTSMASCVAENKINSNIAIAFQNSDTCGSAVPYNNVGISQSSINFALFNSTGNLITTKTFVGTLNYGSQSAGDRTAIKPTTDGGFVLFASLEDSMYCYSCNSPNPSHLNPVIVKLDALGNIQWYKSYQHIFNDVPFQSHIFVSNGLQTSDGGYLLIAAKGYSNPPGTFKGYEPLLIKVDALGNLQWSKRFNANITFGSKTFMNAVENSTGYMLLGTGYKPTFPAANNILITKIDFNGNIIWSKQSGLNLSSKFITGIGICKRAKGGYQILAAKNVDGMGGISYFQYMFTAYMDENGNTSLPISYFNTANSGTAPSSIFEKPCGGFKIYGYKQKPGGLFTVDQKWQVLKVETDTAGKNGCESTEAPLILSTDNITNVNYTPTVSPVYKEVIANAFPRNISVASFVQCTSPLSIASTKLNDATCISNNDGKAFANVTFGICPYTYSWSNNTSSDTLFNVSAGVYTVTITDVGGQTAVSTVTITAPAAITLGTITPSAASCGLSNGSAATAIATGGTGTLTYSWSNGNSGQTATNLAAQTYTLTVRDANNCSTTTTVNIGSTGGASITSITKTDALCNGGTGSATVNITGGASGNYTYSWSNGANTITSATSNQALLTSNTYTVTVIDGACSTTSVVSITAPPAITLGTITPTAASCGQSNGFATTALATGGTGILTYSWSNGNSGLTANNLSSGTYTLTVRDGNNCTTSLSTIINNSPAPTINSITPTNAICNGGLGIAVVAATGTGTLTYSWSNGNTGSTASNLTAGTYTLTVSDGNGCNAIQTTSITQPPAITLGSITPTAASCGQNNGSATTAIATGGTGTLTYSWSNGNSGLTATNLSAQTYTLTVKDANNCTTTSTLNIGNTGGANIASLTKADALCNGSTGSATVTITPSTAPYTYTWSNGASTITTATSNQEQLTSNTYTVTITDANNCSTTTTVQINQPAILSIATPIKTDASCNQNNGSISITASGGTTPYTYSWSNGVSSITTGTSNQTLLSSNTYTVTVTDNNGCSTTTSTTIINISSTINAAVTTNITSNTITEGESIVLSAGGGTSYTWTPNNTLSCATCPVTIANPTATTTYTLIAKDNLGCADTTDITINVKKPCTGEEDVFIANVFSPNNDGKNDVLQIQGNGLTNIYFAIYDRWGNLMFETRDQAQGWDGNLNGNTANAGTYVYYLKATCKKTLQEIILKGNVSVVK